MYKFRNKVSSYTELTSSYTDLSWQGSGHSFNQSKLIENDPPITPKQYKYASMKSIFLEKIPRANGKQSRKNYSIEQTCRSCSCGKNWESSCCTRVWSWRVDGSILAQKKDSMEKIPRRKRSCRTGITKFPALERILKGCVTNQREYNRAVTTMLLFFYKLNKDLTWKILFT